MMIHRRLPAVLMIVLVSLFPAFTSYSDTMYGTLLDDTLTVYAGEDFERIVSYTGSDTILIEANGSLTWNDSRIFASSSLTDNIAIDSGAGDDLITTHGSIVLATGAAVTTSRLTHTASSSSTGIKTDLGNDTVDHNGSLTVSAQSTLTESTLSSTLLELYKNSIIAEILNNGEGNLINTTCASATGIDGDAGDDVFFQRGVLMVSSEALDTSQAVTRLVSSDSTGIVTGLGDDTLFNESRLSVSSTATLSPSEVSSESDSIAIALATANATAKATGVDTGAGSDAITNTHTLETSSLASSSQETMSSKSPLFSASAGLVRSHAESTGIDAGGDDDTISNTGTVNIDATALTAISGVSSESGFVAMTLANPRSDAHATGITGGLGDDTITSNAITSSTFAETAFDGYSAVILGVASSCSTSTASAVSTGISADAGNDTIHTTGVTDSQATANADAVKASVSGIGASSPGPAWIGGTRADASAEGMTGGLGDDLITADNNIITRSTATTSSVSGSAVIVGMASAVSTSKAVSTSQCISGDAGNDTVISNVLLDAEATSTAASIEASVSGVGVSSGSVWESGTTARSRAGGISTGIGEDIIENNNTITIHGESNVDAAGISASLVGVAVSDTSTRAVTDVIGIDSGTCNDRITNQNTINATAIADADALSVTASLIGGAAAVDGIWNGGTSAEATSTGITGHTGDDIIQNLGPVRVNAQSNADTVKLAFSGAGFALTADSGWNGGTTSSAESLGIDGGAGDDTIDNSALITSTSDAISVSTSGSATVVGLSASVSNSEAESIASGIDGGSGDDTITNTGAILSDAYANVKQTSITAALAGASITTDSLWRGGASSNAVSTGINGGLGSDVIVNNASITALSESDAFATDVALTGLGLSLPEFTLWDTSTQASSLSVGIDGNAMNDDIQNTALVHASSTITVDGRGIAVTLLGLGRSQTGIAGEAESIGIDGGACNDTLMNSGTLDIDTLLTAYALNVTVGIAGVADGDVSTYGLSTAKGMDGSCGNDSLNNTGTIDIASTTTLDATGVTVNLIGTAAVDAKAVAAIQATGMDGGEGDDTVENKGDITFDVYGSASAGSVSVDLAGTSESSVGSELDISVTGLAGSGGNDTLVNSESGTLDFTRAETILDLTNVSFSLAGTASADEALSASATSTGMDGGEGCDTLTNQGLIDSHITSTLKSDGNAIVVFGSSVDQGSANSNALALGMNGGGGNDTLNNQNSLVALAQASAVLNNDAFTFGGTTESDGSISAITRTTGLSGGAGKDTLKNSGSVTSSAIADFTLNGNATAVFGTSESSGYAGTRTDTAGMDGEVGDDTLVNTGSVQVHSTSRVKLNSNSFTFGGVSDNGGELNASSDSTGMRGGDGRDTLDNKGSVVIRSTSGLTSSGSSDVVFGTSGTSARVGSRSITAGMDGGLGDDTMTNTQSLDLESSSHVDLSSSSFSLGGTAGAQGNIRSYSLASGILGGDGNDGLSNTGQILVNASSSLSSSNTVNVGFGVASSDSAVSTASEALGMDGGLGNDHLSNSGNLDVTAGSTVTLNGSSFTFGGNSQGSSVIHAETSSVGMNAGDGLDNIENMGNITVSALSAIESTGHTATAFGNNSVATEITGLSHATGINLGNGDSAFTNEAALETTATADSSSDASSSYGNFSDGRSEAVSHASGDSQGIVSDPGNTHIINNGTIMVESNPSAVASSNSDGAVLTLFNGDAFAEANAVSESTAIGILLDTGDHCFTNNGLVDVWARPAASSTSISNGDGADGDGTSSAESVGDSVITGFQAEDGNTRITNNDRMALTIAPSIVTTTHVDADTNGDAKSDSWAGTSIESRIIDLGTGNHTVTNSGSLSIAVDPGQTTLSHGVTDGGTAELINVDAETVSMANAVMNATGIQTGPGNQDIENKGSLTIDATIKATAESIADGDGADGDGDSNAYAWTGARAWGIRTGDGENHITNSGQIVVKTRPEARAVALVDSDAGGSANAYSSAEVSVSSAWGILTGNGNQTIINTGSILVSAESLADADNSETINGLAAVGIETGSGNDIITNTGSLMVTEYKNGTQTQGLAIKTGDGSDAVSLEEGSSVIGTLDLGAGNDLLSFTDDAALYAMSTGDHGMAYGGSGDDGLTFSGSGTCMAIFSGFENTEKKGAGTYTVRSLTPMQALSLENGTLHMQQDYTMTDTGTMTVQLLSSDEYGQLSSDGTINLAGSLVAEQSGGAFATGDVLDIIVADDLEGEFASVTLPESTELLTFSYEREDDRAQIEVGVESFTTVAKTDNEMAIATYLDAVLPHARGSLNTAIGNVQRLSKGEFNEAFYAMGPASYLKGSVITAATNAAYTQTVRNRMNTKRTEVCMNLQSEPPLLLAYNGNDIGIFNTQKSKKKSNAAWANAFGQWGDQDTTTNLAGFDYDMAGAAMGMDRIFNNGILIGLGLGYSMTRTDMKDSRIESDLDMLSLSAYGSKLLEQAYVESVLSVGHGNDDTEKNTITGTTTSSHDVNFVSAMLGWGFYERKGNWMIAPFSHARYLYVTEDSFEESGPAPLSVDSRNTDFLTMDLGANMTYAFETPGFTLIPELSLSWVHDFDINHSVITAGFSGMSQSFVIQEGSPEKDSAVLGLGMSCLLGENLTTSLSGSAEFRKDYLAYGVLADVRYAF